MRAQTAPGACAGCSQQIAPEEAQVRFPECDKAFHWDCWFDETIANCHRDIEQQEGVNAQLRREMGQLRAEAAGPPPSFAFPEAGSRPLRRRCTRQASRCRRHPSSRTIRSAASAPDAAAGGMAVV